MSVALLNETPSSARAFARYSDVAVILPAEFELQSGEKLSRPELQLRIYGDASLPAIAVAGGVSAGRIVADDGVQKGWWRDIVSDGGAIDLQKFCVVSFDFLPNPGERARTISTADQAAAFKFALEKAGIPRLFAFVGASYGGMLALAFAERFSGDVETLCIISAAERPNAAATALRGVQRRIIELAARCGEGGEGVSLARQLAMVSYRTTEEFDARFEHKPGAAAGERYAVCDYLVARGGAYQMTPARYVTLSDSIDRHCVDLSRIKARTLAIGAQSDRLVPEADMRRLAAGIDGAVLKLIPSLFGHDAFLKETRAIGQFVKNFIEE
ncbi:MAG: homoserine O-succinyltransferase [Parvularculaceae bacterium]